MLYSIYSGTKEDVDDVRRLGIQLTFIDSRWVYLTIYYDVFT